MERDASEVEETVVVNHDDEAELDRTIVRPRRSRLAPELDETIVVDRGRGSGDAEETIVVRRSDDELDETVVVRRDGDEDDDTDRTVARPSHDDDTIIVDRSTPSVALPPVPSLRRARPERRRGIAPPPIPAGFAPAARPAVGPGAVERYTPREPGPPPSAPIRPEGVAAPRIIDPTLPSVARRARRTMRVAISAFVGACVISVVGLALIVVWML